MKALALVALAFVAGVSGHARLRQPASRASMWRDGYDTVPDYNDNAAFCGGYEYQWSEEVNGACGICGDAWGGPRDHERPGGVYANEGIIVETYEAGQEIDVAVEITTQHMGHWEFRICKNDDFDADKQQECFDANGLLMTDKGETWAVPEEWEDVEVTHHLKVKLPDGLTCQQCIFQWHWTTGNTWGTCEDGTEATGCGPQETFRGCADVAIV